MQVSGDVVSGLRYIQVVRRAGINVDKTDAMLVSPEVLTWLLT